MTLLIIIVLITILVSANCSLYEAVLYSTRRATLESAKTQAERGRLAKHFIKMKTNISEPIAAILILNTIANTAGASMAGMYAAQVLGPNFVPVFSILFTLAILFLAEIMPKTVGAIHWKNIWPFIVYPLQIMKSSMYPLIIVTEKVTRILTRGKKGSAITEDEILALVHLGAREGEITHEESRMVKNIIHLEDKKVEQVMTPRGMIFSLDANTKIEEAFQIVSEKGFTRIPIYTGDKENIVGYVLAKDIFSLNIHNQSSARLKDISRSINSVHVDTNCLSLLNQFLKNRTHIEIVMDEYGGVDGLVSLEDLLETALGTEIVDETDREVDLQEAARKKLKK
jgi:CBS domain containing-hemolysin-like protein